MLAQRVNAVVEELFHCMTIEINVLEAFTCVSLDVTIPFILIRCRQNNFHNVKNSFSVMFYIRPVKLKVQCVSSLQSISRTCNNCQKYTETPGLLFWDLISGYELATFQLNIFLKTHT